MVPINIFYAADVRFYQHLCVSMVSLLENNRKHRFSIHVLTDDEDAEEHSKFYRLRDRYDNFDIRFMTIADSDIACFQRSALNHVPVHAYSRCLIPVLFPEVDRGIYLDCDTVVVGDIGELWNTSLDGYGIAGAPDLYTMKTAWVREKLDWKEEELYINSGVLLMDLEKMRNEKTVELLIETALNTALAVHGDQEIINKALRGRVKGVDMRFNWCTWESREEKMASKTSFAPIVGHFTGQAKPWSVDMICRHSASKRYFHYLAMTPYRDFIKSYKKERIYKSIIPYMKEFIKGFVKLFLTKRQIERIHMKKHTGARHGGTLREK